MEDLLLRSFATGLAAAALEMAHGVFRVRVLNPRCGDRRARRVGVFTGSLLLFGLAWLSSPWVHPDGSRTGAMVTGGVWLLLLLALDIGVGRWVFRFGWRRIAADFDPRKGNLLLLGMVFALLAPLIAVLARSL